MNRPFVKPEELLEYTSFDSVQKRPDEKLISDIAEAELYVMNYCKRDFADVDKNSVEAESLILAVKKLAEMSAYNKELRASAANSGLGGRSVKSESEDGYTYQYSDANDDMLTVDNIGVIPILDRIKSTGSVRMRMTIL